MLIILRLTILKEHYSFGCRNALQMSVRIKIESKNSILSAFLTTRFNSTATWPNIGK